jgi:ethanolamine transporter
MGGYQLADVLSTSHEGWLMAMVTGYMAGATIVFSIPVGLSILEKRDHKYMALGILSGILSIPIGVLITSFLMLFLDVAVRATVSTDAPPTIFPPASLIHRRSFRPKTSRSLWKCPGFSRRLRPLR